MGGYSRVPEVKNQSLTISTLPFTMNQAPNQYFKLETLLLKKKKNTNTKHIDTFQGPKLQ